MSNPEANPEAHRDAYAVVKTSGRQYRVRAGDSFSVEKLEGTPGSKIQIDNVLMLGGKETLLGTPYVSGAKVTCIVENQYRGPKILIIKKKRRHKYRRMQGHRSELTRLFVSEITTPSGVIKASTNPHVMDPNREKKVKIQKEQVKVASSEEGQPKKPKSQAKKSKTKTTGTKKKVTRKRG